MKGSSTSSCTLHIAVDTDLSAAFDGLVDAKRVQSGVGVSLFQCPPRTHTRGVRAINAVAQTVVLTLVDADSMPSAAAQAPEGGRVDVATSDALYAAVVLDAQQVPPLLSTATAHRCPAHPSGAGPLGHYLDAVVDGLAGEATTSRSTPCADSTKRCNSGAAGIMVRLSLIVAPNATASLDGLNTTNVNITPKEAATLFSAAAAWSVARQEVLSKPTTINLSGLPPGPATTKASVQATLDLCTTVAQPRQALQMIAALGNKLLKTWAASAAGAVDAEASVEAESATALKDVRPDTQRKCIPTDFHALYTSMLTEVSSFSERKTIAAVTAFPTMCHLLEYVDKVAPDKANGKASAGASGMAAVYSTNYGEQRSWNVLNDAIVEALVTEYGSV